MNQMGNPQIERERKSEGKNTEAHKTEDSREYYSNPLFVSHPYSMIDYCITMAGSDLLSQFPFFSSAVAYAFEIFVCFALPYGSLSLSLILAIVPFVYWVRLFVYTQQRLTVIRKPAKFNTMSEREDPKRIQLLSEILDLIELVRFTYSELK